MMIISTEQVPKSEQHSHAHSLLSRCLKEFGVDYTVGVTPVTLGEHGKPSLAMHPELHFSISHADGIAAAMVSEHECGIDCEPVRRYDLRVIRRVCSDTEQKLLETAPADERELLFFSLWTLKEAYVKAIGKGLTFPLKCAAFAFEGDRIVTELKGCRFLRYVIGNKFVVSLCELTEGVNKSYDLQISDEHIII